MTIERYDPKERVLTLGYWLKKILLRAGSSQSRFKKHLLEIYQLLEQQRNTE